MMYLFTLDRSLSGASCKLACNVHSGFKLCRVLLSAPWCMTEELPSLWWLLLKPRLYIKVVEALIPVVHRLPPHLAAHPRCYPCAFVR